MHFFFIIEGGVLNLILEFLLIGNVNVGAHSKLAAKKARKHRCTAIASDNTYGTAFLCVVFTTPSSRFMIILYTALYNISNAGLGGNMLNITYRCVNAKYFVQATAIKNSISGVLGFCATLLGSSIVSSSPGNQFSIFGITVYSQQLLALASFLVLSFAAMFSHFVLSKQDRLIQ